MPGVIIRGGPSINPQIAAFNRMGLFANGHLQHNGVFSNIIPFVVMNSGIIRSLTVRNSVPLPAPLLVTITKNGVDFLSIPVAAGDTYEGVQFGFSDYPVAIGDLLACRINGSVTQDISVQINLV